MAVYSVARESLQMGIVMALAVGLHNVPMGMILYTTLRKETKRRMYGLLAAAVLSTFVGGLLMAALWTVLTDFFIGIRNNYGIYGAEKDVSCHPGRRYSSYQRQSIQQV